MDSEEAKLQERLPDLKALTDHSNFGKLNILPFGTDLSVLYSRHRLVGTVPVVFAARDYGPREDTV